MMDLRQHLHPIPAEIQCIILSELDVERVLAMRACQLVTNSALERWATSHATFAKYELHDVLWRIVMLRVHGSDVHVFSNESRKSFMRWLSTQDWPFDIMKAIAYWMLKMIEQRRLDMLIFANMLFSLSPLKVCDVHPMYSVDPSPLFVDAMHTLDLRIMKYVITHMDGRLEQGEFLFRTLSHACRHGHLDIIQYLYEAAIWPNEFRACISGILRTAIGQHHMHIICFLFETVGIGVSDFLSSGVECGRSWFDCGYIWSDCWFMEYTRLLCGGKHDAIFRYILAQAPHIVLETLLVAPPSRRFGKTTAVIAFQQRQFMLAYYFRNKTVQMQLFGMVEKCQSVTISKSQVMNKWATTKNAQGRFTRKYVKKHSTRKDHVVPKQSRRRLLAYKAY